MSPGSSIGISLRSTARSRIPGNSLLHAADVLRDKLCMTGTNNGCDMGACGASLCWPEGAV